MVKALLCACATGLLAFACATEPKRLVLSDEMRPPSSGDTHSAGRAAPAAAPEPYVIHLAENGRVWEFDLPRDGGGYELRVPLSDSHVAEALTQADREMVTPGALDARTAAPRSLLLGLASVSELYRQHRYELALVQAADLEKSYPDEPRIYLMKGSLYRHLGKRELARDAYQKALSLDPTNLAVSEALRELVDEEER